MLYEVENISTYLIVTCNDENAIRADQRVMHQNGLHATDEFVLEVKGFNVVMRTFKTTTLCCG